MTILALIARELIGFPDSLRGLILSDVWIALLGMFTSI